MAYTEFYCNPSTGDNSNGGSDAGSSPTFNSAIGVWDGTSVYTVASTAGAVVDQFANVSGGYVARIDSIITNTSITLSTTAKFGSAPAAGVRTMKVGGAWLGPNGSTSFPVGNITPAAKNSSGDIARLNFKNNATYNITAGLTATFSVTGVVAYEGYTTSPGDGGRAIIDGGTSGSSYTLFAYVGVIFGKALRLANMIFQNNGATGSATAVNITGGADTTIFRITAAEVRGIGLAFDGCRVFECEAYHCNLSFTSGLEGIRGTGTLFRYCLSQYNGAGGFRIDGSIIEFSIAAYNSADGFYTADYDGISILNCDAYNNTGNGLKFETSSGFTYKFLIHNCNFIKNGGYGILQTGTGWTVGYMLNCGFGSGSEANTSGTYTLAAATAVEIIGTVAYASGVNPYADISNSDFRIILTAAKGAGRSSFTESQSGTTPTVGYIDIGAAQHLDIATPPNLGIRTGGKM